MKGGTGNRLALVAATVLLLLPILLVSHPPLVDYPNHLARAWILTTWEANPQFQETFDRSAAPIPNVAVDLMVPPLLGLVGPVWAGRVFLSGVALLWLAGTHLLARGLTGHSSPLAAPVALAFYSSPLFYGFVNYVAGVALFMVALGHWLCHRDRRDPAFLTISAVLVFAGYLAHLTSYAAIAVGMVWFCVRDWRRRNQRLPVAATRLVPLVPPLMAFGLFMGSDGQVGTVVWGTPMDKVVGLLPLVIGYHYALDAVLLGLLVLSVVLALRRFGLPEIATDGAWLGMAFLALFLVSPKVLLTASGADSRWVLPGLLLLLLSLGAGRATPGGRRALTALASVLLGYQVLRVGAIAVTWDVLDRQQGVVLQALLPHIERGTTVYGTSTPPVGAGAAKRERAFNHAVHYATVYRDALVSRPFAHRGQQPLFLRDPGALPGFSGSQLERARQAAAGYDYLWLHGPADGATSAALNELCAEEWRSETVLLCRVAR